MRTKQRSSFQGDPGSDNRGPAVRVLGSNTCGCVSVQHPVYVIHAADRSHDETEVSRVWEEIPFQ